MIKELKIIINSSIFPIEAYCATSLSFIDDYYIYLDKKKNNIIICIISKTNISFNKKEIEGRFRNELLNNALRIKISQDNFSIRESIINQALFSSLPSEKQESLVKNNSYQDDPLGIAIPWEEKFSKKAKKKK